MSKTYEMKINDEEMGVFAMSIVSDPAMESKFITLSKQQELKLQAIDEDKRLLMGVAMIPNKLIPRISNDGTPFNITFSKDTIRQTSELFLKNQNQGNTTFEHALDLQGNTIVESWIKEDEVNDKSVKYGIEAPIGSWIISMKVEDDVAWNLAKKGELTGFSIEGIYDKVELNKQVNNNNNMSEKSKVVQAFSDFIDSFKGTEKEETTSTVDETKEVEMSKEKVDLSAYVKKEDLDIFLTELSKQLEDSNKKIEGLEASNVSLKKQLDERMDAEPTNTNLKRENTFVPKTSRGKITNALFNIKKSNK